MRDFDIALSPRAMANLWPAIERTVAKRVARWHKYAAFGEVRERRTKSGGCHRCYGLKYRQVICVRMYRQRVAPYCLGYETCAVFILDHGWNLLQKTKMLDDIQSFAVEAISIGILGAYASESDIKTITRLLPNVALRRVDSTAVQMAS